MRSSHDGMSPHAADYLMVALLFGLVAIILCLTTGIAVLGQDADEIPLFEVVPAQERLSARMIVLVDTSSSMSPYWYTAINAARSIADQPTDEMELGVIAFNVRATRWPGIEDGTPRGWCRLPSALASDGPQGWRTWLFRQVPGGGTRLDLALEAAMTDRLDGVSLVVVTDGRCPTVEAGLQAGRAFREAEGLDPVIISVLLVAGLDPPENMRTLAREGRGGLYCTYDPGK